MKLNGNLICLEQRSYVDDTLDAYNFTIPQIKQIYIDKGNVSLIYDNDYTETKYIEEEIAEKDEIVFKLINGKELHIYSDSTVMLFVPQRLSHYILFTILYNITLLNLYHKYKNINIPKRPLIMKLEITNCLAK